MSLRTRKPSGAVAYPTILLEGEEKAGKSFAAYRLSSSPRVGRTFVFDLGEGTADEYAELGPYEIVEHNGTFSDLLAQLEAAAAEPAEEGRPNVIVLDDATALWDLLKDWAGARARNSKRGRQALAADPDAEIDVPMNLWNDAKDRWYRVLNLLRGWPGIAVLIARGKEVSKVVGGQPVAGQTEWKVETEKSTAFAVSAWVRMTRPHVATLVAARSLHVDVPARGLPLEQDRPLEHLIFDVLGAGGDFTASTRVLPSLGLDRAAAKKNLLELLAELEVPEADRKDVAGALWRATGNPAELTDEQWAALEEKAREKAGELKASRTAAADASSATSTTDPPPGRRNPAAEAREKLERGGAS